ncbi:MAG TPA: hypothetical protein VHC19_01725 [Pirellulales bacterium]|nr:hypothetical protein [Pirellulales bacterium]
MTAHVRAGGAYLAAVALCLLILSLLFDLPSFDLSIPLVYGNDALLTHALAKTLTEQPWYLTNPALGAPGAMEINDFPMADGLHFLWLKLLSFVRSDWAGIVNLYFLLTFPLTTLTSLYAMRRLGLSTLPAIVGSLLFAFLPYHLIRNQGHLLLAAYYVVPLSVLAAVWVYRGEGHAGEGQAQRAGSPWRRRLTLSAICLLQASAGVYYAAFACFSLLVAGISGSLERRKLRPLATAVLLIAATAAGVVANVSPTLRYWSQHGRNPEPLHRPVLHAELFGLKLAQLVLPVTEHRWRLLAKVRDRYHHSSLAPNENDSVTLGSVGALGFASLLLRVLFMARRRPGELLGILSKLNLAGVLLATIGGFGVIFNLVVDPHIRCYNRIGVFLGFFALTAAASFMQPWADGWGKGRAMQCLGCSLLGLVLVLGILDQAPPSLTPAPAWVAPERQIVAEQFRSDAEFVARVEAAAPPGAMIFQMPYMVFPEAEPAHRAAAYDHLRPYLHSKQLRWSFGCMRGRQTDLWRRSLQTLPLPERLATIENAGFQGLLVNRRGFADSGQELERELQRLTGSAPIVSRDEELAYFSLENVSPPSSPVPEVVDSPVAQPGLTSPVVR